MLFRISEKLRSIAASLDLAKQFGVSIKVAAGPHERVARLQYDSVFAMSPSLQFTNEINAGLHAPAEKVIAENATLRALRDYLRAARKPEACGVLK